MNDVFKKVLDDYKKRPKSERQDALREYLQGKNLDSDRQIDWLIYCCNRKMEKCLWRKASSAAKKLGIIMAIPIVFLLLQTNMMPSALQIKIDPFVLGRRRELLSIQTEVIVEPNMIASDSGIGIQIAVAALAFTVVFVCLAKIFAPTESLALRDDLVYLKTELNDDGTTFRTLNDATQQGGTQ